MTTVVVHLTASRFFGGPERQMLELAHALPPEIRSVFISFAETGLCRTFLEQARAGGFEAIALRHDTPRLLAALRELLAGLRRAARICCAATATRPTCWASWPAGDSASPSFPSPRGWTGECARVRLYEAIDRQRAPLDR